MQALEIQGIKMQTLLIAMHLFFRFVEFSMLYVLKTIVIILLPYYRENRYISSKGDTCWQRMNQLTG